MRVRLRHAMQGQGVFVCFCCAAPVVREKRRQGGGLAARGRQSPQQASASRAGAAPAGRPSPTRTLPQRTRGSPERFVPAADRVRQRRDAIREAERDQAAAAAGEKAVLAELRAIGLSLTASTGVHSGQCGHGGGAGTGKTTSWLGPSWAGVPVGEGGKSRQRHCSRTDTVGGAGDDGIYACCVKRRVCGVGGPVVRTQLGLRYSGSAGADRERSGE